MLNAPAKIIDTVPIYAPPVKPTMLDYIIAVHEAGHTVAGMCTGREVHHVVYMPWATSSFRACVFSDHDEDCDHDPSEAALYSRLGGFCATVLLGVDRTYAMRGARVDFRNAWDVLQLRGECDLSPWIERVTEALEDRQMSVKLIASELVRNGHLYGPNVTRLQEIGYERELWGPPGEQLFDSFNGRDELRLAEIAGIVVESPSPDKPSDKQADPYRVPLVDLASTLPWALGT